MDSINLYKTFQPVSSIQKILTKFFLSFKSGNVFITVLFTIGVVVQSGCRKFVEVETPIDRISQSNVYSNDLTATTALTSIYSALGTADLSMRMGLLADEWTLWTGALSSPGHSPYYINSFVATNNAISQGAETWNTFYNLIFRCNAAIEGLNEANSLSTHVKAQLLGEAHFMRAWLYFYLVNLYGDLPLAVGTDPEVNRLLRRSSVQIVHQLITEDLLKAQQQLSAEFVTSQLIPYTSGTPERVRPTKWAATAMLSKIFLYQGLNANAEVEANKLIENTNLFSILPLQEIFLKNSREAIWQIQPTEVGWNTSEARMFHLSVAPAGPSLSKPVHLSPFLLEAFEAGDHRKSQWVDSLISSGITYHFPVKYKIGLQNPAVISPATLSEYSMLFRLSELYLIRAEARARENNVLGAIADLDVIRRRAGLPITDPGISKDKLLDVILHERQVELFTETGHRWMDLKRFGKVNEVMSMVAPQKGGIWEDTDQLLPIPYNDLIYAPNLTQNDGY